MIIILIKKNNNNYYNIKSKIQFNFYPICKEHQYIINDNNIKIKLVNNIVLAFTLKMVKIIQNTLKCQNNYYNYSY